jgi:queuosine precursor transporter
VFAALMATVIVHLPPRDKNSAVEAIFGNTPRIIAASIIAFWSGSFVNSYVLAEMKLWTRGRWLWTRTIGSTICGELVDSALFYTIAFAGLWSTDKLLPIMMTQYLLKSAWEMIATPLTYKIVGFLKRAEQEDYYHRNTRSLSRPAARRSRR